MPIAFQIEHHSGETDRLSTSWTIRANSGHFNLVLKVFNLDATNIKHDDHFA